MDWDSAPIGELYIPETWADARAVVNWFTAVNMIHPQLWEGADINSIARTDTYRGKYPHVGPKAQGGTVEDGEDYPLTNKLDYVFYKHPTKKTVNADGSITWTPSVTDQAPAPISDPWADERREKREAARRAWPRQKIYVEERFFYAVGAEGIERRHSLRYLPWRHVKADKFSGSFRVGRDERG